MAENKKSFVLYCDLIHTVRKMPKEKQADLFMHILSYVNDENPVTEDIIIELTFEPIKWQLKRDLDKYEKVVERNRINGKSGGRPKKEPKKPIGLNGNPNNPIKPKKPDNDNGSDNDTDNDILLVKETKDIYAFDEFWNAYPNKQAKQKAKELFDKLPIKDKQKIKDTISAFILYKPFKDYSYPQATTYIRQQRYLDDMFEAKPSTANKTNQLQPKYAHHD